MKSQFYRLVVLFIIFYFPHSARAQNCFHPSASIIPISFFQQNNETAFIYFSGDSTFLRGPHSEQLNFLSVSNNYKVDISFTVSMAGAGTIMGQNFNDYGWYIAFDQNDSNKLKFFMSMGPYNVQKLEIPASSPPYDTNWVKFRIVYSKAAAAFTTYQNNILAHQYNGISWQYQTDIGTSFALGRRIGRTAFATDSRNVDGLHAFVCVGGDLSGFYGCADADGLPADADCGSQPVVAENADGRNSQRSGVAGRRVQRTAEGKPAQRGRFAGDCGKHATGDAKEFAHS
jgi:hypothetical protein